VKNPVDWHKVKLLDIKQRDGDEILKVYNGNIQKMLQTVYKGNKLLEVSNYLKNILGIVPSPWNTGMTFVTNEYTLTNWQRC
jgi:hypothetical protein